MALRQDPSILNDFPTSDDALVQPVESALLHSDLAWFVVAMGFLTAWAIGTNDFANSAGPAVGAKVLGVGEAIVICAVFELAGAVFFGSFVTETVSHELIGTAARNQLPGVMAQGMTAAMLAAVIWLVTASVLGWPVSTTHAVVGAIVGFGIAGFGIDAVQWGRLETIGLGWLVSPLMGAVFGFVLMQTISWLILKARDPARRARIWGPFYVMLAMLLISLLTLDDLLRQMGIELGAEAPLILPLIIVVAVVVAGLVLSLSSWVSGPEARFGPITVFTMCAMAFAHGSNDVANAVGPMVAVLRTVEAGFSPAQGTVPFWLFVVGGVGIVAGASMFGFRVVGTVGRRITLLTPCRAYAIMLSTSVVILLASRQGIPVSTTHTLVGAVVGVGLAGGMERVHYGTVAQVMLAWLLTLPVTASLAAAVFFLIRWL